MDEEGIMYLAFSLVILLMAFSLTPKMGGGIVSIFAAFIIVAAAVVIVILNFADYLASIDRFRRSSALLSSRRPATR